MTTKNLGTLISKITLETLGISCGWALIDWHALSKAAAIA
jgi:hypothetical protein